MCRLAAFPPNFPKRDAYNIMWNFLKGNTDGTGSIHIKDGQFVTRRYPFSLTRVVKEQRILLGHMPYPGWTVVHVRAASHGDNKVVNTHPFIKGKWGVVHNGVWSEYNIAKAALHRLVEFEGETDTEVAAYVFSAIGPKKFSKLIDYGGVYLGLHQSGDLWAVKTSGDLVQVQTKYGTVLASELPGKYSEDEESVDEGWIHLGASGKIIRQATNTSRWTSGRGSSYYPGMYSGEGYGGYGYGGRGVGEESEIPESAMKTKGGKDEPTSDRDLWDEDDRTPQVIDPDMPCWE